MRGLPLHPNTGSQGSLSFLEHHCQQLTLRESSPASGSSCVPGLSASPGQPCLPHGSAGTGEHQALPGPLTASPSPELPQRRAGGRGQPCPAPTWRARQPPGTTCSIFEHKPPQIFAQGLHKLCAETQLLESFQKANTPVLGTDLTDPLKN